MKGIRLSAISHASDSTSGEGYPLTPVGGVFSQMARSRRNLSRSPFRVALLTVALAAPFAVLQAHGQARQPVPPDVNAAIRAADAQKKYEILERTASFYEALKNYDLAQTLFENALAIREERIGQQDAGYAAALVKLGDLSYKRRQYDEAEAFYAKAVALGDRPE
jgi:tetratricopeptide (TPR) repeat protein